MRREGRRLGGGALAGRQHPAHLEGELGGREGLLQEFLGEDADALSLRTRNVWSRDETAVMNGLAIGEGLPADEAIKIAVPERWTPRDPQGAAR